MRFLDIEKLRQRIEKWRKTKDPKESILLVRQLWRTVEILDQRARDNDAELNGYIIALEEIRKERSTVPVLLTLARIFQEYTKLPEHHEAIDAAIKPFVDDAARSRTANEQSDPEPPRPIDLTH